MKQFQVNRSESFSIYFRDKVSVEYQVSCSVLLKYNSGFSNTCLEEKTTISKERQKLIFTILCL